ncbi:MAG: F0F1 ATP synthase subunit A [Bacteroidetes bacterium]|nr:F0F1 ATP synthase subunit A [Bacteroidota bacterium]MBL6962437.1 F0F1 ATP synthase subunit A [Bacteroidota bacterium]
MYIKIRQILIAFILANPLLLTASGGEKNSKDFNLVNFALHHIADSYSWDFYEKQDGSKVGIQLPRVFINLKEKELNIFASTHHAEEAGYVEEYLYNPEALHGKMLIPGAEFELKELTDNIHLEKDSLKKKELEVQLNALITKSKPLDFSITKNVLFMVFAAILLLWIFISVAKKYKQNPNSAPRGLQSALEPIIVFVRDEIAKTYIPHKYERYLPLLLNFFFFIWILNMMGLIPFSSNVTGNFSVTASLALITFFATNLSAKGSYWKHIFWFPGVPIFVKPIMLVVEFVSVFTKPFALMIRLFANITAGHLVILSFISLIFIFGKMGMSPGAGWATSFISVIFALFIDFIEILIALLQAYIFTTLSALFIGQAVETEH